MSNKDTQAVIRGWRTSRSMTDKELGKALGMSYSQVRGLLYVNNKTSLEDAVAVCDYFDQPLESLAATVREKK